MLHILKVHGGQPPKEYTIEVFSVILEVLSALTHLYPQLEQGDPVSEIFKLLIIIRMLQHQLLIILHYIFLFK